jgi:transcriptional regulator with XRE-family HTH domain
LSKDAPTAKGRAKVANLVKARMKERGLRPAELARLSGLTVNTINGVTDATGNSTKSTLVALAAVLEWNPQYLYNTVCDIASDSKSPLEAHLANLVNGLAEIGALRTDIRRIEGKIDVIGRQRSPDDNASSD